MIVLKNIKSVLSVVYRYCLGYLYNVIFIFNPIEDKVLFSNFSGKRYGDNPRYISQRLHERRPDIKQVWMEREDTNLKTPDYVEKVSFFSLEGAKAYRTSKIWVDSHSVRLEERKRRGQYFIETWHGSFQIKKIEGDAKMSISYRAKSRQSAKKADLFISNSRLKTEIYRRAFGYRGEVLECGYPKNDIFFSDTSEIRKKVCRELNIEGDYKILLYAPTYRDSRDENWFDIDFEQLHEKLKSTYDDTKWMILVRLHPVTATKKNAITIPKTEYIIDATDYPNMQDLLAASDIYMTDYSSAIYDFTLMKKPSIIYCSDLEEYQKNSRELYWDISKDLPFPVAKNNHELMDVIEELNTMDYSKVVEKFNEIVGPKETGNAADIIVDKIVAIIDNK